MTKNDEGPKDILGLAPYGEALNTLAKGAVEGAGAFLGRICLPAAEEFGLLLRDRIGGWRANNAVKIALKAQALFEKNSLPANFHAHPRLVMKVVEEGSWAEADEVQDMWAGLLTSSCSEDGMDETNLIFVTILAQLTHTEASILKYGCEKCEKQVSKAGWIGVKHQLIIDLGDLERITGLHDIHRLQADCDHLADEAHDVLRVIRAVRIVDNAAALVGADLVLIDDPVQGRTIAQAVFEDFGRNPAESQEIVVDKLRLVLG